ncbi:hypothetical protein KJ865_09610 [Myxococcota bacterium]|nr:hypothetical protein [Myxococcota bacterium]
MLIRSLLLLLLLVAACTPPHESDAYLSSHGGGHKSASSFPNTAVGYTISPAGSPFSPQTGVVKINYEGVHSLLSAAQKARRTAGRPFTHSSIPLGGMLTLYVAEKRGMQDFPNRWALSVTIHGKTMRPDSRRSFITWDAVNPKIRGMSQFTLVASINQPVSSMIVTLEDRAQKQTHRFTILVKPSHASLATKTINTIRHHALFLNPAFQRTLQYDGKSATIMPRVIATKVKYISPMLYDDIKANYQAQSRRAREILENGRAGQRTAGGVFHRLVFATSKGFAETCTAAVSSMKPKRVKLRKDTSHPFYDRLEVVILRPIKGAFTATLTCQNAVHTFNIAPTASGKKALFSTITLVRKDLFSLKKQSGIKQFSWDKGLLGQSASPKEYMETVTGTMKRRNALREVIEALIYLDRYLSKFRPPKIGKAAFRRQLLAQRKEYIKYCLTALGRLKTEVTSYLRNYGKKRRSRKTPRLGVVVKDSHAANKAYLEAILAAIPELLKELKDAHKTCARHKGSVNKSLGIVPLEFPKAP